MRVAASDGAVRRYERLPDYLAAEHALPADLRAQAAVEVHLEPFDVEDGQKLIKRAAHGPKPLRLPRAPFSSFALQAERGIASPCRLSPTTS